MNHCPVTADTNRYLSERDRAESLEEMIDEKLEEMMQDQALLAACIDEVLAESDVVDNGSTGFANDLAQILMERYTATSTSMAVSFMAKLRTHVEARMRLDAETEVNHTIAHQNTRD